MVAARRHPAADPSPDLRQPIDEGGVDAQPQGLCLEIQPWRLFSGTTGSGPLTSARAGYSPNFEAGGALSSRSPERTRISRAVAAHRS